MRRTFLNAAVLAIVSVFAMTSCDELEPFETVILPGDAPMSIQDFVDAHFPDEDITYIERDRDDVVLRYEVYLTSGVLLEFNRDYEIVEIYSDSRLPDSVIPTPILDHVNANFPDRDITDWELYRNRQEIQLDNDLEVHYDLDGTFIRIDD